MAGSPILKGYKALGGSSRKYLTPSGKTISRREYDNRRLKKLGYRNRYEAENFRQSKRYTKKRAKMERAGRKPRELDIFSNFAQFVHEIDWQKVDQLWGDVNRERKVHGHDGIDFSPDSAIAEVLIMEGAREAEWEWDVGDTPKGTVRHF